MGGGRLGRIRAETLSRRAWLGLAGAAGFAAPLQIPEPVIRVDVRLVRLLVTVKDEAGRLVGGLEQDRFAVLDSGEPQKIAVFERQTAQPLSVSLLIDTSGSTAKDLKYEVDSASRFLRALTREGNPGDALALYSFNHDVTLQSGFTRRPERIQKALESLKAEAGTSLYDAIILAAEGFENRDGRHVMVVITDGGDTTSYRSFHDALEAAHRADAVIYPIVVVPITNDAGRNVGGEHALITLGRSTGGRTFFPSVGPALDAAFTEILRDLRTQYLIGYYPHRLPGSKKTYRRVQVSVSGDNLRAFSRDGYYEE